MSDSAVRSIAKSTVIVLKKTGADLSEVLIGHGEVLGKRGELFDGGEMIPEHFFL